MAYKDGLHRDRKEAYLRVARVMKDQGNLEENVTFLDSLGQMLRLGPEDLRHINQGIGLFNGFSNVCVDEVDSSIVPRVQTVAERPETKRPDLFSCLPRRRTEFPAITPEGKASYQGKTEGDYDGPCGMFGLMEPSSRMGGVPCQDTETESSKITSTLCLETARCPEYTANKSVGASLGNNEAFVNSEPACDANTSFQLHQTPVVRNEILEVNQSYVVEISTPAPPVKPPAKSSGTPPPVEPPAKGSETSPPVVPPGKRSGTSTPGEPPAKRQRGDSGIDNGYRINCYLQQDAENVNSRTVEEVDPTLSGLTEIGDKNSNPRIVTEKVLNSCNLRTSVQTDDLSATTQMPVVSHATLNSDTVTENPSRENVLSERTLQRVAKHIGRGWEFLALDLGLKQPMIDRIKLDVMSGTQQQIYTMLVEWKKNQGVKATRSALRKGLRECDGVSVDLAEIWGELWK